MSELLYEWEAERAFERQAEIEEAAAWCKARYPHKFKFLNEIYKLLIAEERDLRRHGLFGAVKTGAVKLQPILTILTPSQALRLLESFKRFTLDHPDVWKAKNFTEIAKVENKQRLAEIIADTKAKLVQRND